MRGSCASTRAARPSACSMRSILGVERLCLVGGRKRGQDRQDRRFYRQHVRQADAIYDRYLRALNREPDAGRGRER